MIGQQFTRIESPLGAAYVLKPEISAAREHFNVLQITDCHLGAEVGERLAGMDTDESLDHVLASIADTVSQGETYDLLLATGDLANHESASAYLRLQSKLNALDIPSAWLPGNHDSYELMVDTVGIQQAPKMVVLGRWHFLLLDSAVPGSVGGCLGDRQIQLLKEQLQSIPEDAHIVVSLHHQPVSVGSEWLDYQRVADSELLLDALADDDRLKAVIWGHVHQEFETTAVRLGGARLLSAPSTCIQFAPDTNNFKLHDQTPGYRLFSFHADGHFETSVRRLQGVEIAQDLQSRGY